MQLLSKFLLHSHACTDVCLKVLTFMLLGGKGKWLRDLPTVCCSMPVAYCRCAYFCFYAGQAGKLSDVTAVDTPLYESQVVTSFTVVLYPIHIKQSVTWTGWLASGGTLHLQHGQLCPAQNSECCNSELKSTCTAIQHRCIPADLLYDNDQNDPMRGSAAQRNMFVLTLSMGTPSFPAETRAGIYGSVYASCLQAG